MCDVFSSDLILVESTGTLETPEGYLLCGQQGVLSDFINVLSHAIVEGAVILKHCFKKSLQSEIPA